MAAFELLILQARRHCIGRPSSLRFSPSSSSFLGSYRLLCSSSSSSSELNPDTLQQRPNESVGKTEESAPIKVVSYAARSEEPHHQPAPAPPRQMESVPVSNANADARYRAREDIQHVKDVPAISPVTYPIRTAPMSGDEVAVSSNAESRDRISEDMRHVTDESAISPVCYPSKTTPLPVDRVAASGNVEARNWTQEDFRFMKDVPEILPVSYPTRTAPLPEDRVAETDSKKEDKKGEETLERESEKIEAGHRLTQQAFKVEEERVPFPTLIKVEKKEKQKVIYDLAEAIRQVKANAKRNFDETIEAHVKLGLNMRRTDLTVHGAVSLPHGIGKALRVAVFAEGDAAEEARAAGADIVGGIELVEEIKNSKKVPNVDRCISTELFMDRLKKISMVLRSLMPNPRKGTVTNDVAAAVRESKQGLVDFKMDKTAIVHVGLGKASFPEEFLRDNIGAFVNALLLAKPVGLKKTSKYAGYVNSFHLCSTMGPGYPVSIQSLSLAADHFNKLNPRQR